MFMCGVCVSARAHVRTHISICIHGYGGPSSVFRDFVYHVSLYAFETGQPASSCDLLVSMSSMLELLTRKAIPGSCMNDGDLNTASIPTISLT